MKNLTPEEIKFIDTYLKNSGVEFLDVRVEMIDHVASAIEEKLEKDKAGNFYETFKSYMIKNKKSLLKSANSVKWSVDRKVLLSIKKELFKIPVLLVGAGIMTTLLNVDIAQLEKNLWFQISCAAGIFIAYLIPVVLSIKQKISFLNRLSIYAYLINYLFFLLLSNVEIPADWLGGFYGLLVWVNLGILLTAFKMSAYYKKQFASI
jgi:hypothetical protein